LHRFHKFILNLEKRRRIAYGKLSRIIFGKNYSFRSACNVEGFATWRALCGEAF
jgi:hypothetical protein